MSTWVIGQIKIHDPKIYKEYADQVLATMRRYEGRLVFLSDAQEALEGEWHYPRTVMMEFADRAQALAWYNSSEYQAIIPLRKKSADVNIIITDNIIHNNST